jgi:GNAT superfamily N-acetyltransferase
VKVLPLTLTRWADFEAVLGARGCSVANSCGCMFYRRTGAPPPVPKGMTRGGANRGALKALLRSGVKPGLIAYEGKTPVGWLSLGPREEFKRLEKSPVMKAVDGRPVWSVICFVVPSEHRGKGVAAALLRAGIVYAKRSGATILEAYPVDKKGRLSDEALWFGTKSMFDKAGFKEAARRKPSRPVVRLSL